MSSVNRIQILSDRVANKIAAGEVVERPASVIKELIENSLDAGATHIEVEVIAGGRKYLCVRDNGHGMSRDDALLSLERHATSKIKDVDDIECVGTMGFRGEAVPAIASVSRLTLTTRLAGDVEGTEINVSGGKIQDAGEAGCPPGTSVTVRNLFFNVPARRKFLRSEQTEVSHIRQVFLVYALANPGVGLRLLVDEREVYNLPAGVQFEDRLRDVYSADLLKTLRTVDYVSGELSLRGFVGVPSLTRGDRSDQYIFVNGRPASAPAVWGGLKEAYRGLLAKDRHPVLFLFIDMDPSLVDVNVHPTKKEVRFRHPGTVRDALVEGVRKSLSGSSSSSVGMPGPSGTTVGAEPFRRPVVQIENLPAAAVFQYPRIPFEARDEKPGERSDDHAKAGIPAEERPWSWSRVVGQVGGLYVLLETEEGLVVMDPHAAHARVLYERLLKELADSSVESQGLLTPEAVELPPKDALRVRKGLGALQSMGFGISEFGGDTFIVDALPACLGDVAAAPLLIDLAQSVEEGGARAGVQKWAGERIARSVSRSAVASRDRLTLEEIEKLVVNLGKAEMPYTCPHGHPTLFFMSYSELNRKFGKT
ncbi:MAG: DNA mismatch repair endonuclease MutL [Verrucomicrobia bacterium]|nr:DNA mismatch repair endonuclease MutL [Verrucomicrobiota bacterium]